MNEGLTLFFRVLHLKDGVATAQTAAITALATGLGVERRLVQHHHAALALCQFVDLPAVAEERNDIAAIGQLAVAGKFGLALDLDAFAVVDVEVAGGTGALALGVHCRIKTGHIDFKISLTGHIGSQIDRKAVGVVKLEHGFARDLLAGKTADRLLQQMHALVQSFGKTLLFLAEHLFDLSLRFGQFRIGFAHLLNQRSHQLVEEAAFDAQFVAVANGAADNAAQHITAPLVGGDHPVGDQEGTGADVISDDLERGVFQVFGPGQFGRGLDQVLKQIDLVVGVHALHHRREALQAHAGVDRGLGQRLHVAGLVPVVLHEHQVPDLDITVAVLFGGAGRPAPDLGAVVIEDLGTGTAGTGIAHRPEVVAVVLLAGLVTDAGKTVGIDADLLEPDIRRLIILLVNGYPQLLRRETADLGEELPGILDSFFFKVVTETEVAQHLEEGMVTCGVADVFQVIVLAAGPHTALH